MSKGAAVTDLRWRRLRYRTGRPVWAEIRALIGGGGGAKVPGCIHFEVHPWRIRIPKSKRSGRRTGSGTRRSARPASWTVRGPSSTCWTCFRIRAGRACMWGIRKDIRRRTSRRATSACGASTSCIRWAGTRSGCRRSSTPSRPATIRARSPTKTSPTSGGSSRCWASPTTGTARSPRRTRNTCAGRSGSSCSSSSAGWPTRAKCR